MGAGERAMIDARISELRKEAESKGQEFRIVEESRKRVTYQTRWLVPGYEWHAFSVQLDGHQLVVIDQSTPQRGGCWLAVFNVVMLLVAVVVGFVIQFDRAWGGTSDWTVGWVVVIGIWVGGNTIAYIISRKRLPKGSERQGRGDGLAAEGPRFDPCPGCGKRAHPTWENCPFCKTDLTG